MDNKGNKENQSHITDPVTGKRKVVLGEDDFSNEAYKESEANNTPGERKTGVGFFDRFLNRDAEKEPQHDANSLTDEAKNALRDQQIAYHESPVFDEEKDRLIAEESTRDIPVELLESKQELENPAARLVEEADTAAIAAERQELARRENRALTDQEKRRRRIKNRWTGGLITLAVAALLILFAPSIQELIFKTPDDSLIFSSVQGLFGPRSGILMILLGLVGLGIVFSTMFTKRKEDSLSKKPAVRKTNPFRTAGLVMLILIPIGFAGLFNFTEFRNSDIRTSSLFNQNKLTAYEKVDTQSIDADGNDLYYTIKAAGSVQSRFEITRLPVESIKLLDNKLPVSRNVYFSSEAIQKLEEKKIYTNEEIVRLFINKQPK